MVDCDYIYIIIINAFLLSRVIQGIPVLFNFFCLNSHILVWFREEIALLWNLDNGRQNTTQKTNEWATWTTLNIVDAHVLRKGIQFMLH